LVAAKGACHLTEWVEGKTPNPGDPQVVEAAGALLGIMHGAEVDPTARRFAFPYRRWEERNRRNATELRAAGALGQHEAEWLFRLLVERAPAEAEGVIVHGDLAPENLVRTPDGRLMLVDNENLAVDAQGFDLARTWYRWPMTEERWPLFWRGYRTHADPAPFLDHAEFWKLVVLAEAAHFRVLQGTPGASLPLRLLLDVIRRVGNSAWFGLS
jgi:Ser/Thr protein kinase RdoA (MazF antagonist)